MEKFKITVELDRELVYNVIVNCGWVTRNWANSLTLSRTTFHGIVVEHADGPQDIHHHINPVKIQNALRLMARDLPIRFSKIASGNYDAVDSDALLQLICFGSERDRGHRDALKYG